MSGSDHQGSGDPRKPNERALRHLAALAGGEPPVGSARGFPWRADDLADLWRHQLAASIVGELARTDSLAALRAATACAAMNPPATSLADVLHHDRPAGELLRLIFSLAHTYLGDPEPLIPQDLAMGLLCLVIVAARLRASELQGAPVNGITDGEVRRRANWLIGQHWLDQQSHAMATEALKVFVDDSGPL